MLNDAHPTYHAIQLLEAVVLERIKDFNEFVQPLGQSESMTQDLNY
jgi:hypothetical protein